MRYYNQSLTAVSVESYHLPSKFALSWYCKSKCIICHEIIFHDRTGNYLSSRIAHGPCISNVKHPCKYCYKPVSSKYMNIHLRRKHRNEILRY